MDTILLLLKDPQIYAGLIAGAQMLVGKIVKNNPGIDNTFIPIFTFLAAVLGYSVSPIGASGPGEVVAAATASTAVVTAAHSIFKNTLIPIFVKALPALFKKIF